jgi:hypothetical protein
MSTFLALLTGGGLAAIGGLVSSLIADWLGGRRDQRKYKHERAMAIEARRQERLAQAYIDLLGYLSHHAAWAMSVRSYPAVKAPDPLLRGEVKRVEALVESYGSPEVRGLLRVWRDRAGMIADADAMIGMVERSKNPSQELENEARQMHVPYRATGKRCSMPPKPSASGCGKELAGEV